MRTRAKFVELPGLKIFICGSGRCRCIGFVFSTKSASCQPSASTAAHQHIPPYVQTVGLFVNASAEEIQTVLEHVALDVYSFMVMKHLNNASKLRAL
jgi:phosphoribosylanthranilate isomerase